MSFFENMFGHKNEPMQPENMSASPSNEPEEFDDERKGASLDEKLGDFTDRLDNEDEETDIDQAA